MVVQANALNRTRISTTIVAALTSNRLHGDVPGNVFVPKRTAGLPKDSVANVSRLLTVDQHFPAEKIGTLPPRYMTAIDAGLKFAMDLM